MESIGSYIFVHFVFIAIYFYIAHNFEYILFWISIWTYFKIEI